jgi:hypothetical protein
MLVTYTSLGNRRCRDMMSSSYAQSVRHGLRENHAESKAKSQKHNVLRVWKDS